MQSLCARRVWCLPLLQGHEEVRGAWSHEAVVCPSAVLGSKWSAGYRAWGRGGGAKRTETQVVEGGRAFRDGKEKLLSLSLACFVLPHFSLSSEGRYLTLKMIPFNLSALLAQFSNEGAVFQGQITASCPLFNWIRKEGPGRPGIDW